MFKYILPLLLVSSSISSLYAADSVVDTQLLDSTYSTATEPKFDVHTFASCTEMRDRMGSILEKTILARPYPMPYMMDGIRPALPSMSVGTADMKVASISARPESASVPTGSVFTTNIQVAGVDEAEIVKTNGTEIYTYNQSKNTIYVYRASDLVVLKEIKIPSTYVGVEMYLQWTKLTLTATKYTNRWDTWYGWYSGNQKTVVAVYDVSVPTAPVLQRQTEIDGYMSQSRMIDGILYMVSTDSFQVPYMYSRYSQDGTIWKVFSKNFALKNMIPRVSDMRIKGKKYTRETRGVAGGCDGVEYILPDAATLKNVNFSPSFATISAVDTKNPDTKVSTKLIFGDVSNIHVSTDSMYVVSSISVDATSPVSAKCPPNARCAMPAVYTPSLSYTLVHAFTLDPKGKKAPAIYRSSTTLPGSPLSQYSMDAYAGDFRIITHVYNWDGKNKSDTNLFVISADGKVKGSLRHIAPGENFQSSRFIGDRLYLVTFEQIDPFFVIDISDSAKPRILGELKIPGYSTYLHPYDKDRLIGIGYDTITNQYGNIQNGGLKVDLYNVSDVKKPTREATLTLGDMGSYSEVLSNPRTFVWYAAKNTLYMPATLMKNAGDKNDIYRNSGAFQWVVAVSIQPGAISEVARTTHVAPPADMYDVWQKECRQYVGASTKPTCYKVIGGGETCTYPTTYVPPYCYEGSTVDTYIAANIWNFSDSFINRALYIGDTLYTVSNDRIRASSIPTLTKKIESKVSTPDTGVIRTLTKSDM